MDRLIEHATRLNPGFAVDRRAVALDCEQFEVCPAAMLMGMPSAQLVIAKTMYELAAAVAIKQVAREEAILCAARNN